MKKALIIIAALALVVWVISWFRTPAAVATSGARVWPGGLESLEAAAQRFPPRQANGAAVKLASLAIALPKNDALDGYVRREITRNDLTIGAPPSLADTSAIRELLLRQPIVWQRREGIGGGNDDSAMRTMQMTMARMLVAGALAKGRAHDPAAWEELHAAWNLARSLEGEPQMMFRTAAMTMARMANAVAWKMPLPAPPWLGELQQRDYLQPLLESFHYQAASYWRDGARMFPTRWLADSVEKDRRIAEQLFNATACDVNVPMNDLGTDLRFVWRRAFRYRAEREAVANALRARQGKPIESHSRCSDGAWTFDGNTLRFSREIATAPPDMPMPLVLRLGP
jgi:hypothetical protein